MSLHPATRMHAVLTLSSSLSTQAIEMYRASQDLVRAVEAAHIADADLSDHATVAAKSAFLSVCEGLPLEKATVRLAHLERARAALHHVQNIVDLAVAVDDIALDQARTVEALAARMEAMLVAIQYH